MTEVSIRIADAQDHPDILRFYEACGYSRGIGKQDTVLMASSAAGLIGVVRLCREYESIVLRGMQVLPDYQRQGIGRRLLKACEERIGDSCCYCIPWSYLADFYASAGFKKIGSREAPNFLKDRASEYLKGGLDVVIMRRRCQ